jgi:hypothetical protein
MVSDFMKGNDSKTKKAFLCFFSLRIAMDRTQRLDVGRQSRQRPKRRMADAGRFLRENMGWKILNKEYLRRSSRFF